MRVAGGDLSPEALRRLNAALLADPNCQRITLPIPRPVEDPRQSLTELGVLLRTVRRGAADEAIGAPLPPDHRARLLANSAEAVARIAQLDALHRDRLGLLLQTAVPRDQTAATWTTAWLLHAQKRGLAPALAASHLEAASRVPLAESSRVPQQVAMVAAVEGVRLVRKLGRRRERELRR